MNYGTMPGVTMILPNHNVVGTCGECGGPVVSPMLIAGHGPAHEFCQQCGKTAKPSAALLQPYGPLREMK